jgi:hypothetical protein
MFLGWTLLEVVGASGFEPETSCAQGRRATRLRYAPTAESINCNVFVELASTTLASHRSL